MSKWIELMSSFELKIGLFKIYYYEKSFFERIMKVFALEFFLGNVTLIKNAILSFLKIISFLLFMFLYKNLSIFFLGNLA